MRADDRTPDPEPGPSGPQGRQSGRDPVYCTLGETLCRLQTWTPEEWERLEPAERPVPAEFVPGLGWIAPIPTAGPI